jgi:hypothetical protein
MTDDEHEQIRLRVAAWKKAAPVLERLRREAIRTASTAEAIEMYSSAFRAALRSLPPRKTSGLIQQQAVFRKLYRK